mmetsp:Transcript_11866/g.30381  ORF Transcript_11866/g.30381 Transcript_11866/m.30381 type:complete len:313 (+) Transcript_11866:149-1087(+)
MTTALVRCVAARRPLGQARSRRRRLDFVAQLLAPSAFWPGSGMGPATGTGPWSSIVNSLRAAASSRPIFSSSLASRAARMRWTTTAGGAPLSASAAVLPASGTSMSARPYLRPRSSSRPPSRASVSACSSLSAPSPASIGRASVPSATTRRVSSSASPCRYTTTPLCRYDQFCCATTAPPPVATTHVLYAPSSANTCVSSSRKAASPSSSKISGIFLPDSCSMRSSESKKQYLSVLASSWPTVLLPLPIMPTRNRLTPSSLSTQSAASRATSSLSALKSSSSDSSAPSSPSAAHATGRGLTPASWATPRRRR